VTVGVLGAAALLAVGVWGVVNLAAGDWFIGGLFVACALFGVPSVVSRVRRLRREERDPAAAAHEPPRS
jgi:hypothetical protein